MNNQEILFKAIEFAGWAHRNRELEATGIPLLTHPFHVMTLLFSHEVWPDGADNTMVLAAGVLHETLVAGHSPMEVTFTFVEERFGTEIAAIVRDLVHDMTDPDRETYFQRILACDWRTRIVKVADILSNVMAVTDCFRKRGFKKTHACFELAAFPSEWFIAESGFLGIGWPD